MPSIFHALCAALVSLPFYSPALAAAQNNRVCISPNNRCFPTLGSARKNVNNNETITLQPGRYERDVGVLRANGVTIKSASETERAVLDAKQFAAEGKGILVVKGNDTVIEGLEFRGAAVPSKNGAGIRFEGGDLIVRRCRFEDNEMGILGGNGGNAHIQIIDSEFARSYRTDDPRISASGYPAHNIYIGQIGKLTVRGVWSHSTEGGHPLKSRARENDIEANYFSTRQGSGSYEAEFPSGGQVRFVGNIVEQGINSANHTMLAYGLEHPRIPNPPPHTLTVAQNTFVNHLLLSGTMLRIATIASSPDTERIANNVWVGPGRPNLALNESARATGLGDYANCDFRLTAPVRVTDRVPPAGFEYVHPAGHRPRTDRDMGAISPEHRVFQTCP
jgi:hypothetical protein